MTHRILTSLALVSILAAGLVSCSGGTSQSFAERFIAAENKAWGAGETQDLKALEDVDVVYHLPGADLKGWAAHEGFILEGRKTVSDLHQEWKYLSGEKNHFVLSYSSRAVSSGDGKSPAATVSNSYLFVFRLENGKIKEVWANGTTSNTPAP